VLELCSDLGFDSNGVVLFPTIVNFHYLFVEESFVFKTCMPQQFGLQEKQKSGFGRSFAQI
jgi:hypothetical protein